MNKDLMLFDYANQEIRTKIIDDVVWFVGKDVAKILGYENTRDALIKLVDKEDKRESQITTPGGSQKMILINEPGLYSLIFSSRLEGAKKFKRWVFNEVLPSIRKNGEYQIKVKGFSGKDFLNKTIDEAYLDYLEAGGCDFSNKLEFSKWVKESFKLELVVSGRNKPRKSVRVYKVRKLTLEDRVALLEKKIKEFE